jgi:hypothetical protein
LRESYLEVDDAAQLQPCTGSVEPVAAELDAHAAARRRDWLGVLRAVGSARADSAFLRQLAGNARWSMRELRSARLEYRRALELADDPAMRSRLEDDATAVAAEIEPIERASHVAARNAWWQLGVVVAALAVTWLLRRT